MKKNILISLVMLSVLMTINYHVAYAEDNSSMDAGETILYYSFETQETKQIGYNSDTHTFYEMDRLPEYLEHDDSAAGGDGTADIAPLWSEPGTIYVDEELIKEDPENPYAIILFKGVPYIAYYDPEQEENNIDYPWIPVNLNDVDRIEGVVKTADENSLILTTYKNYDFEISINENEEWNIGDKITVFGLVDDTKGVLTKQYGYFSSDLLTKEEE